MFTGIIEEVGIIRDIAVLSSGRRLKIEAPNSTPELRIGDSVAVDGICLTVTEHNDASFQVEAVEETLKKTTIGFRKRGDRVNLELPLRLNERLGGHIVLGHVDTVGIIERIETRANSWMFYLTHPAEFSKYIIRVGSIAINGVSLTVAERSANTIGISIIPHTWQNTTFQLLREGDKVNIEFDLIGKYILNVIEGSDNEQRFLTEKHLRELGF
jgi:riboflavin synthase